MLVHRHDLHDTNAGAVHVSSILQARQTIKGCLVVCKLVRACIYGVVLCCVATNLNSVCVV